MITRIIVGFVFIVLFSFSSFAAHIVGGEISYEVVSMDDEFVKYKITAILYRDAYNFGAPFDPSAEFGIYEKVDSNWTFIENISSYLLYSDKVSSVYNNTCLKEPGEIRFEFGKYEFFIELKKTENSYMISHQRCCRNSSIINILNPGDEGFALTLELTSEIQANSFSSPTFNDFVPSIVCINEYLVIDHSVQIDMGDSIVYSFFQPLSAGGTRGTDGNGGADECDGVTPSSKNCPPPYRNVTYINSDYSFDKPIPSSPLIEIDRVTGVITGEPNTLGFYLIGISATEYIDGKVVNVIRREFEFVIVDCTTLEEKNGCEPNTVKVEDDYFLPQEVTIYAGESVKWEIKSGSHNIIGGQDDFPDNPESFSSGATLNAPWNFSYLFNKVGQYEYKCGEHTLSRIGIVNVLEPLDAIITKSQEKSIVIFPNPTIDLLQISSEIYFERYEIIDLYGRFVEEGVFDNTINTEKFKPAVYLIKFIKGDKIYISKFIKR